MTPTTIPAHADAVLFAERNPASLIPRERKYLERLEAATRLVAEQRRIDRQLVRAAEHLRAVATIEDRDAAA